MIKITISEKDIFERSNDFELGEFVRAKYWELKNVQEGYSDLGKLLAKKLSRGNNSIDNAENQNQSSSTQLCSKDRCVICGDESPYLVSTHIDLRIGYVEGGGQGCFQPHTCKAI